MGIVGAIVRSAQSYPALLPIIVFFLGASLWAVRSKRWVMAGTTILSGSLACLLYTSGAPALAARPGEAASPAGQSVAGVGSRAAAGSRAGDGPDGEAAPVQAGGRFTSVDRLHPRFPRDFPLPGIFRLESNSSGRREGTLTTRFRFRGEGAEAVRALRDLGLSHGWEVEQKAPHRLVFRKDGRSVEAWFSYPAHSVVLDVSDRK